MITIVLLDPNPISKTGLSTILGKVTNFHILAESSNILDFPKLAIQFQPKLLLIDFKSLLQMENGLSNCTSFAANQTVTVIINANNIDDMLFSLIQAGVLGALGSNINEVNLENAIMRASQGEILFSQEQIESARLFQETLTNKWNILTDREREILFLLYQGFGNKIIAIIKQISIKTVSFHVSNILRKLSLESRQELIIWYEKYVKKLR